MTGVGWQFGEGVDRCCQTLSDTSAQPRLLKDLAVSFVDDAEEDISSTGTLLVLPSLTT